MKSKLLAFLLTAFTPMAYADVSRVGVTYGQGAISHAGDVVGNSGQIGQLGVNLEYLKTNFSSTYHIQYSILNSGPTQSLFLIEKGYFYYPRGAAKTLKRNLDIRVGLLLGGGKYELSQARMNGIFYDKVSSGLFEVSAAADMLFNINRSVALTIGGRYMYGAGVQDIFWTISTFEITSGLIYRF